jgi:hypothetical protein
VRIERALPLDLRAIADGVIKNNMGLGGLEVRVRGLLDSGTLTTVETNQKIRVAGGPVKTTQAWVWLQAREFGLGHADAAAFVRETPGPSLVP